MKKSLSIAVEWKSVNVSYMWPKEWFIFLLTLFWVVYTLMKAEYWNPLLALNWHSPFQFHVCFIKSSVLIVDAYKFTLVLLLMHSLDHYLKTFCVIYFSLKFPFIYVGIATPGHSGLVSMEYFSIFSVCMCLYWKGEFFLGCILFGLIFPLHIQPVHI